MAERVGFEPLYRRGFIEIIHTEFYQKRANELFSDYRELYFARFKNHLCFYDGTKNILIFIDINGLDESFSVLEIFEQLDPENTEINVIKVPFSEKSERFYLEEVKDTNELIFSNSKEKFLLTDKSILYEEADLPFFKVVDKKDQSAVRKIKEDKINFSNLAAIQLFPSREEISLSEKGLNFKESSLLYRYRYNFEKEKKIAFEKINDFISKNFRYYMNYIRSGQLDNTKSLMFIDLTDAILTMNFSDFYRQVYNKEFKGNNYIAHINFMIVDLIKLKKLLKDKKPENINLFEFAKADLDRYPFKINKIISFNRSFLVIAESKASSIKYVKIVSDNFIDSKRISTNLIKGYSVFEGLTEDLKYILVTIYSPELSDHMLKIYKNPLYELIELDDFNNDGFIVLPYHKREDVYFKISIKTEDWFNILRVIGDQKENLNKAKKSFAEVEASFYVFGEKIFSDRIKVPIFIFIKSVEENFEKKIISSKQEYIDFYIPCPLYYENNLEYNLVRENSNRVVICPYSDILYIEKENGYVKYIQTKYGPQSVDELFNSIINLEKEENISLEEKVLESEERFDSDDLVFDLSSDDSSFEEENLSKNDDIFDEYEKVTLEDAESDIAEALFSDSNSEDDIENELEVSSNVEKFNGSDIIEMKSNDLESNIEENSDLIDQLIKFKSKKEKEISKNSKSL